MATLSNLLLRKRLAILLFLLTAGFLTLGGRLAWVQLVQGEKYRAEALANRLNEVKIEAKRGAILDRQGKELALSISAPTVVAFPPEVKKSRQEQEIAAQLAPLLGLKKEEVLAKITRPGLYAYVRRKISFEAAQKVRALGLPGIEVIEESQRFYPNGSLAAHVLGIAGIDNQGLEGLEFFYDRELRGVDGSIRIETDALGREAPQAVHAYFPPVDGNTLVLTLDRTLQYVCERELDALMRSPVAPRRAGIVALDPRTGEILALANRPTFDPNNYQVYPPETRRNLVVADAFELGSVFKIVTAAGVLEEGVVLPEERFYCSGSIKVGRETIKCWVYPRSHGSQTFRQGVTNSCNPVFVTSALRLEEKKPGTFYKYIRAFGFGSKTGIDFPGEGEGILIPAESLKPINLATIAIGQGIAVTPLQMLAAAAAVANKGVLMRPHLVKEVRSPEGALLREIKPEAVRQVVSPETAQELASILEMVVSEGTGANAYLEGYRVGGKTGTAQKPGPGGYQPGKYVASFLGFAPADAPRLALLVLIDEPQGYPYFGGTIAAPIFKRVTEDSLRYLGVAPQYNKKEEKSGVEKPVVTVPQVVGMTREEAVAKVKKLGLNPEPRGEGKVVVAQTPKGGARLAAGIKVILYLGEIPPGPEVLVPDVTGKRIPEAARIIEAYGLKLLPLGSGEAVAQEPFPGRKVTQGTAVKVTFREFTEEQPGGP